MKNLTRNFLIPSLVLLFSHAISNGQSYNWNKQIGGSANETGRSIISDASGNVYTTGWFAGSFDFNPGSGFDSRSSAGNEDGFLTKLDANGNYLWTITLGSVGSDFCYEVKEDNVSNIIIVGRFVGTVDFDPSATSIVSLTAAGSGDIFLVKYSSAGALVWVRAMGGTSNDYGLSLAVDNAGNIISTGYFNGTCDFNPGSGINTLTSLGSSDIFISKIDASGNYVWAKAVGGTQNEEGKSIQVDGSGNVVLTGYFQGTVDFDPGSGIANITALGMSGFRDIYILKLDVNGDLSWIKRQGGIYDEEGTALKIDNVGNIYTTGYFNNTCDFDPSGATSNLTAVASRDVYVSKLDPLGALVWVQQIGGSGDESGQAIEINPYGYVGITGVFTGVLDCDPSVNTSNITSSASSTDLFFVGLTNTGLYLSSFRIGGTSNDGYITLSSSPCNIHFTGQFQTTVDFNPGVPYVPFMSNGGYDIFMLKMQYDFTGNLTTSACNSYTSPSGNHTWTVSGIYTDTVATVFGCDSILTITLNMFSSSSNTAVISACDSYVWIDGNTYTSTNNIAVYHTTNAAGCDSAITLNLTITNSSTNTDVIASCDSYTWIDGNTYTSSNSSATHTMPNAAGCDSVITLNLTMNNSSASTDLITACNSYTWLDGITYSNNNTTATYLSINVAGCDSLITLNLTINSIDTAITQSGNTLTSATAGAAYQWIDCATNLPIVGATSQSYTSAITGSFSVIVSLPGCADDTSACHSVITGIEQIENIELVTIFPNPGTGLFNIQRNQTQVIEYVVSDINGSTVYKGILRETVTTIDLQDYESGMYFVNIDNQLFKLIKY